MQEERVWDGLISSNHGSYAFTDRSVWHGTNVMSYIYDTWAGRWLPFCYVQRGRGERGVNRHARLCIS